MEIVKQKDSWIIRSLFVFAGKKWTLFLIRIDLYPISIISVFNLNGITSDGHSSFIGENASIDTNFFCSFAENVVRTIVTVQFYLWSFRKFVFDALREQIAKLLELFLCWVCSCALRLPNIIIIKDSLLVRSPLQKLLRLGLDIAFVHHFAATIAACRISAIVVNLLIVILGNLMNVLYLYSCTANNSN